MKNKNLKIAYIYVTYKESEAIKGQIRKEIGNLGFKNLKIYHIDNLKNNIGYAAGVNKGIKQALKDRADIFIISNPDISLKGLKKEDFINLFDKFDMGGFTVEQNNKVYYGGVIDRWRMSGGLIEDKPKKRYVESDFISGSLMVINKKVIEEIGLMVEDYFLYYEEVDYCYRVKQAGFKIGIDSLKKYTHFEVSEENPLKEKYLAQSRLKFFYRYGNVWQKIYELARLPKTLVELLSSKTNLKFKRGFLIDFFSLNLSSFLSKVLNFILFIFLIKYLNTEEYGIYTLVWAQISIFSPLVDLGTTTYGIVNLPVEKENKFLSLFNLRIFASVLVFIATILVSLLFFENKIKLISYIILTSFVIFSNMFSGTYLIKNAIDNKLYNSSIVSSVFNIFLIISLILSLIFFKSLKLIFLLIFLFYNLYSFVNFFLIKKNISLFRFSIDIKKWIILIKKTYVFVLIGFFAGLYFKLDVFLLQFLKGTKDVGIYSAGYKFFEALIFIAASYNIASTPILSRLAKGDKKIFLRKIKKDLIFLIMLGAVVVLLAEVFAPIFLPYFMKGNYTESIKVLKIVILALPLILISSVFLNVLYVLQKAYMVIFVFVFQATLNFVLNFFYIPKYSYYGSSYITVFSELLNAIILFLLVIKFLSSFKLNSQTYKL